MGFGIGVGGLEFRVQDREGLGVQDVRKLRM